MEISLKKMKKTILLLLVGAIGGIPVGFAIGVYALPIIIAQKQEAIRQQEKIQAFVAPAKNAGGMADKSAIDNAKKMDGAGDSAMEAKGMASSGDGNKEKSMKMAKTIKNAKEMSKKAMKKQESSVLYKTAFVYGAEDSDFFHRGEGMVSVTDSMVKFHDSVDLTPGPDYRLYAVPEYLETEKRFKEVKAQSAQIAMITIFEGEQSFTIPADIDISKYKALVVWCEAFQQFITVAEL